MKVNPKVRVNVLEFIRNKFHSDYDNPIIFTLNNYLYNIDSFMDKKREAKYRMRLMRLVKNGWLKPYKNEHGELTYKTKKKYHNYLDYWGYFKNPEGPLMKSKEPEKVYIEKEVPVEKIQTREYEDRYVETKKWRRR